MSDDVLYADIVLNEKSSAQKHNRLDAGREDAVIYAAMQFAGAPSAAPPKTKAASDTTTAGREDAVIYAAVQFAGAPSAAPPKTKAASDTTTADCTLPVCAAGKASSYRQLALVTLCCLLLAAIISLAVYHFKDQEKYIAQLRNVSLFYGQLETKHHNLTSQNSILNETHSELQSSYSRLNESQSELRSNYSRLNESQSELRSNYSRLNDTHSELQSNYSRLNTSLSKCKQENETLSLKSSILDKYCPLLLNDSNCNLCPEKWMQFNGKCYYFSTDKMDWNSSRDNCTSMGGHLVIIESKAEQDFLSNQNGSKKYWIGLNDQAIEGEWRWVDNTNPKETYWGKRENGGQEPDNDIGNDHPLGEDCVHLAKYADYTPGWYDTPCTKDSYQRICETVAAIIKP